MKKIIILITLLFVCGGCASMPLSGTDYNNAPKGIPRSDTSIIYIIRDNATPTAFGSKIMIDNKKIRTLRNKSFTWIEIMPGEKTITAKWSLLNGQEDNVISVYAKANETKYIILKHDRTTAGSIFNPYVMYNKFVEVDEASALHKINDMKYFNSN